MPIRKALTWKTISAFPFVALAKNEKKKWNHNPESYIQILVKKS